MGAEPAVSGFCPRFSAVAKIEALQVGDTLFDYEITEIWEVLDIYNASYVHLVFTGP